jgi:hypothetical protein
MYVAEGYASPSLVGYRKSNTELECADVMNY